MKPPTRNKKTEGKKRPVCACGKEMTFVEFHGYYDEDNMKYWICENEECTTEDEFIPDFIEKGAWL